MSTTNIDHQIIHYQGDTFKLKFNYLNENNTAIDLAGHSADMHIRRSPGVEKLVCRLNDTHPNGVFGRTGGSDFNLYSGFTGGTGGILLNHNGTTGSVFIEIDSDTVSRIPAGRHFYDLVIKNTTTLAVTTILSGTFELAGEVTK
tara:strand:- start:4622 stop:5056 length:435 start_codon:yes stop_codon:yes gene_type:complete